MTHVVTSRRLDASDQNWNSLTKAQQDEACRWVEANGWPYPVGGNSLVMVIAVELDTVDCPLLRIHYWNRELSSKDWRDDHGEMVFPVREILHTEPLPSWWQPAPRPDME